MSEAYAHPNYVKIWIWLVVLLLISVAGPMLEIPVADNYNRLWNCIR